MKKTPAALVAAASILLAACSGDTKPDAPASNTSGASTTTSAPTTSASPTTAGPTADPNIPAAARAHTPAGAEAFVRYFYSQLNIAWTAPRAGILSPLCQASAVACAANEKTATRLAVEGHRYDGNPITIEFIGALGGGASPNKLGVLANVVQERRSEIDAAGKTYLTDQRKNLRLRFELVYIGQAWSVASTKLVK